MTDLTDFLLARIAEDEAAALPFRNDFGDVRRWRAEEIGGKVRDEGPMPFGLPDVIAESDTHGIAAHIARWDPARVLAECKTKRLIVELHGDQVTPEGRPYFSPEIRLLTLPYADHPDYREEW